MGADAAIEHDLRWPVVSLADIATKIGSGATPRGGSDAYLPCRARFALVRSQNVFDRRFDDDGLAFISDEQAGGLRGVVLQPEDILLNITGDGITFGRACIVPKDVLPACVNQHVSIIRVDALRADAGYVLSFLTHPEVKSYIESFNAGGSRRAITKGHIESFRLPLPPLPVQRAIAHILGTLDDKVELNRRMIETLESIARALFKSWFVDMTANGLPKGWSKGTVGEIATIVSGKRPESRCDKSYPECDVPLYGGAGPMGFVPEPLFDEPILLTGRVGTLGIVHRIAGPCWPSDNTLVVRPVKPYAFEFLFFVLKALNLAKLNRGSTQPLLTQTDLKNQQVTIPSEEVLQRFHRIADTGFRAIVANNQQSRTLAILRDTLLPKLISGELRVQDAERMIGNES